MKKGVFFIFLFSVFIVSSSSSYGANIFVGKTEEYEYHSIWDGLQAAAYGDVVWVYSGTYDEGNITVHEGRTLKFFHYDNITVNFQTGAKLDVEEDATLLADMDSRTLVFQCPSGQWTGVVLNRNCTANLDGIDIKNAYIGLDIVDCTLTMGNVYIYNCSWGISFGDFDQNLFLSGTESYNNTYAGIQMKYTDGKFKLAKIHDISGPGLYVRNTSTAYNYKFKIYNSWYGISADGSADTWLTDWDKEEGYNNFYNNSVSEISASAATITAGSDVDPYPGGNNSFVPASGALCAYASNVGFIDADRCWWGQSPPNDNLFVENSWQDNIHYASPLTSQPGGLPKIALSTQINDDSLILNNYDDEVITLKLNILNAPNSRQSIVDLRRLNFIHNRYKKFDFEQFLNEIISAESKCAETAMQLLIGLYVRGSRYLEANQLGYRIIRRFPDGFSAAQTIEDMIVMNIKFLNNKAEAYSLANALYRDYPESKSVQYVSSFLQAFENFESLKRNSREKSTSDFPEILLENFPNPFNAQSTIKIFIPIAGKIKMSIYNILGQQVASLANGYFTAGNYAFKWNANSSSSGIYFIRMEYNNRVITRKMTMIK